MGSGARTAAVIAADLNNDGSIDLVGTNQGNGSIGVALGASDSFGTASIYNTSTIGPYETVAADFNGDGYTDLASANFGASSGAPYGTTISIHINKGNGSFYDYVDYLASDSSTDKIRAIATGDFNNDGKADLAAAAQGSGLQILLGNGDGSFAQHVLYGAGSSVHGVVVADFNHDGLADVALANNSSNGRVNVLLGKGDGTFNSTTAYLAGSGTFAIATGDLNGDGYPDLITANNSAATISVLINKGSAGSASDLFNSNVDYPVSAGTSVAVTIADLQGDGKADVLSSSNSGGVTDLFQGNGEGTLQSALAVATGSGSYDSYVADFNGDGTADIASANTSGNVVIMRGSCQ